MKKGKKIILFICMIFVVAIGIKQDKVYATGEENPRVYIEEYSISGDEIVPGEEFELTLTIRNTSQFYDIYSVMVTFEDETETVYPVYGDSNQYYINRIYARNNTQITIPLQAAEDIGVSSIPLNFRITYNDNYFIEKQVNDSKIFLPVRMAGDLKVVSSSAPEMVSVGAKARIGITYENIGSENLYNIALKVASSSIEGGVMTTNLYNLSGGGKNTAEVYIDCKDIGKNQITLYFTYEDEQGKQQETSKVLHSINVVDPTANNEMEQIVKVSSIGVNFWVSVISAFVVVVVMIILIVIKKKRR